MCREVMIQYLMRFGPSLFVQNGLISGRDVGRVLFLFLFLFFLSIKFYGSNGKKTTQYEVNMEPSPSNYKFVQ